MAEILYVFPAFMPVLESIEILKFMRESHDVDIKVKARNSKVQVLYEFNSPITYDAQMELMTYIALRWGGGWASTDVE